MTKRKTILFIVGYPLSCRPWAQQSTWYRVLGPSFEFSKNNYQTIHCLWSEQEKICSIINKAAQITTVVLHRVSWSIELEKLKSLLTKKKISLVIDLDDNVFSPEITEEAPHLKNLSLEIKNQVKESALAFQKTIQICDRAILSTRELCNASLKLNSDSQVLLNYIPSFYTSFATVPLFLKHISGFSIYYGPGSVEHKMFFNLIQKPLARFLKKHPDANLVIGGGLSLEPNAKILSQQILCLPRIEPYEYFELLKLFKVVIAPLSNDIFAKAKSWIKTLEPAYQGVPWIASDVPNYRLFHEVSNTGFIATCEEYWFEILEQVYSDYRKAKAQALLARQNIRLDFDIKNHFKKIEALYIV